MVGGWRAKDKGTEMQKESQEERKGERKKGRERGSEGNTIFDSLGPASPSRPYL